MTELLDYIARYVNEHEAEYAEYQEWLKEQRSEQDDKRRTLAATEHSTLNWKGSARGNLPIPVILSNPSSGGASPTAKSLLMIMRWYSLTNL